MRPSAPVREITVSPTPESFEPAAPVTPVDLWAALDRLSRDDRAMLAARRDDVRRSRLARRRAAAAVVIAS
jgi:hypothetical protein